MKVLHPERYSPRVVFRSSSKCNYKCLMCRPETGLPDEMQEPTMPMDLFENALDQAIPHINKIGLTDIGEFMMDPQWRERLAMIANRCRENPDLMFHQITNASLLTKKYIKHMAGIQNATFLISIDSVDPLNYADIRQPGQLANVLANLRGFRQNLAEIGLLNVSIQLSMVLMKRNIFEVPDLLRLAKEIGAKLFLDHMQDFGLKGLSSQSLFNYPAFTNQYLGKCMQVAEKLKVPFYVPPPFAVTTEEIDRYFNAKKDKDLSCSALDDWGPISIRSNGDMNVCCGNLVFGNLNSESFQDIFFSEKFNHYRSAIRSGRPPSPCCSCRFLHMNMPYLYESAAYDLNLPPENRNLDPHPNFKHEGFYDWLEEMPEHMLRHHLVRYLDYQNNRQLTDELDNLIQTMSEETARHDLLIEAIRLQTRVIVYPAGSRAQDLLNTTELSSCNILAFADKDTMKQGSRFNGYDVTSPCSIIDQQPDVVFVACSERYKEQILLELAYLDAHGIRVVTI